MIELLLLLSAMMFFISGYGFGWFAGIRWACEKILGNPEE